MTIGTTAFARRRFDIEAQRIGFEYDSAPDCLPGLCLLLGGMARAKQPVGALPSLLRALIRAEGMALPARAERALANAEAAQKAAEVRR